MKTLRRLFALALLSLSSFAYSFSTLPVDGLWSVVAEQNLTVGRAFNIEMSDKLLVVTIYAYNAQGAPTFYVGAAPLAANNSAPVTLSEPQGGTCLGCPPTSGRLLSSPGVAIFEFTTSTTGFVTLPNEARKAITKGDISRPSGPDALRGVWAFTYTWQDFINMAETPRFTLALPATTGGSGIIATADRLFACERQTTGAVVGQTLCIKVKSTGVIDRYSIAKQCGHRMEGVWYFPNSTELGFFTTIASLTTLIIRSA